MNTSQQWKIMKSMLSLLVFILLFLDGIKAADEDCYKISAEFQECARKAYQDYRYDFTSGEDGRPDWLARRACKYMTAAVDGCGDKMIVGVGECFPCEAVTRIKDEQLKFVLQQVKLWVNEWDSTKCPAAKAHMERMKALENGETLESNCKLTADANAEDVLGIVSESALTALVLSSFLLPLFV